VIVITPSFSLTATERVLPKLALDFTTATLDSRVTFTRSGNTATVTNSSGFVTTINANLPRFDYDPVTIVCKGLLIEESRVNALTYSNEFTNAAWTAAFGSVSLVSGTSPNGSSNVYKFVPSAPNASFRELQQSVNVTSGTTYCFSQYVKADTYRYVQIIGSSAAFGTFYVNWDLSTGTETAFSAGTSTVVARGIINAGNGFYRIWAAVTALSTTSGRMAVDYIGTSTAVRGAAWIADGVNGYQIYGAQFETGAFPTSYIPTTASQVTRSADVATMTGTNFSDWYNASEGAFVALCSTNNLAANRPTIQTSTGVTTNGGQFVYFDPAGARFSFRDYDSSNAAVGVISYTAAGTPAANTNYQIAVGYKTNSFAMSVNGNSVSTDTTGTVSGAPDTFRIGNDTASNYINGYIKKISYFPMRLTNSEIQAFSKG